MKLPDRLCNHIHAWAARYISRNPLPDFIVNGKDNIPYLQRWFIIPRNRFFNIYLHRFISDDEDRALHSHPWLNCTLVIQGSYYEHLHDGSVKVRQKAQLVFRRPHCFHRISLVQASHVPRRLLPAMSLFITGPVVRVWTFACPRGEVPWYEFVDARDKGSVGRGCP